MSSKRTLSAVLAMAGLAVILGATQGCSPGNEPAQSAPGVHAPSKLGNLAPFRTISEDVAAKVDAQDLAGAKPLLIITARPGLDDRLRGLDGGADDFLQKPFEMAELLARMRAVMRRKGGRAAPELGNGTLSLDPASKCARVLEQEPVQLSNREFALLQALLLRPGAILSRGELEDRLYGWGNEVESNAVEFLIHALRRKLGKDVIRNVRGLGWMVSKGD